MFGDEIFVSYGESGGSVHQSAPRKAAPIENKLHCSLEELYKGASKRMTISKETLMLVGVNYLSPWFVSEA
jgi:DnaJ family protein B protein 4